jgi:hypothetical protein
MAPPEEASQGETVHVCPAPGSSSQVIIQEVAQISKVFPVSNDGVGRELSLVLQLSKECLDVSVGIHGLR